MELEKQARIVDDIRAELQDRIDTRLKVRANMGRSKVIECEGMLMQAHPSLFILEIDRKRGRKARQSYQYVDVLTGMVELYDVETGQPIFGSFVDNGEEAAPLHMSDDEEDEGDDEDLL
ncbi:MAG: Veg family protein [Slackia sp.]|nr:Veg family protein [Slackia sp.]